MFLKNSGLLRLLTLKAIILVSFLLSQECFGSDSTWNGANSDWNTGTNWIGGTPSGGNDRGIFGATGNASITFSANSSVGEIQFNDSAQPYTFTVDRNVDLATNALASPNGVINLSDSTQIFNITANRLRFSNSTTVSGSVNIVNGNNLVFRQTSNAGSANITNDSTLTFSNSASGGNSTITNNGTGIVRFNNSSTAGNAVITSTGLVDFNNTTTADNARIINNAGGTVDIAGLTAPNSISIGSISGAGNVNMGNNKTLILGNLGLNDSISGNMTQSGGTTTRLVKIGTGSLTLSGTNTYAGGTTIQQGTVSVAANANLGAVAGSVTLGDSTHNGTLQTTATTTISRPTRIDSGGGTLNVASGTTLTYSGVISDLLNPGALTKTGLGTLNLSTAVAPNTYSGGTTIAQGTVIIKDDNDLGGAAELFFGDPSNMGTLQTTATFSGNRNVTLNPGGANYDVALGTTYTLNGAVEGSGPFTKSGPGTLDYTGYIKNNSGLTTVGAGTLRAQAPSAFSAFSVHNVLNGATLNLNSHSQTILSLQGAAGSSVNLGSGTLTLSQGGGNTFAGNITGTTGGLIKGGNDLFILSGANAFGGTTTISAGTLRAGAANTLSAASLHNVSGTLDLFGHNQTIAGLEGTGLVTTTNGSAILTLNMPTIRNFSGGLQNGTGALSLTKTGAATQQLSGSGLSTYSGPTLITGGQIQALANNVLSPNSVYSISGPSVLDINGHSQTIAGLAGPGTGTVGSLGGPATLTLNVTSDQSFPGSLVDGGGPLSLVKTGAAKQTLAGTSTYTGGTEIQGGTLEVSHNNALGGITGGALIFNGANTTLRAGITGLTLPNAITLTSSGIVDTQASPLTFTLNGGITGVNPLSSFTKIGSGILVLGGTNTYFGDTIVSAGILRAGANNVFSPNSFHTVASGAFLDIAGRQQTLFGIGGSGTVQSTGGVGTLTLDITGNQTFGGILQNGSGTLALIKAGTGIQTLSGPTTYTGLTTISGGTLTFAGNTSALTGGMTNDSAVVFDTTAASTSFNSAITGTGTLTKQGPNTLGLSVANTYSGVTDVTAGTLQALANNTLSSNSVHNISSGATLDVNNTTQFVKSLTGPVGSQVNLGSGNLMIAEGGGNTFAGSMTGTGGFAKDVGMGPTDTFIFSGDGVTQQIDYSGDTQVLSGTLQAGSLKALSPNSVFFINSGAFLDLHGFDHSLQALAGGGTVKSDTASATLTVSPLLTSNFPGALTDGTGILSFTKSGGGTQILSGSGLNTYSGPTTVSGGILRAGANNVLSPNSSHTVASGAFLDIAGTQQTLFGIGGAGTVESTGGVGTLTLDITGNQTFGGTLQNGALGTLSLIKAGVGSQTLSGNNTYTGGTTIQQGTLAITANNNLGDPAGPLAFGTALLNGTLQTTGTFSMNRATTLNTGGGTIDITGLADVLTFQGNIGGTGSLTKAGPGELVLSGNNALFNEGIVISEGTLTVDNNDALGTGPLTFNGSVLPVILKAGAPGLSFANEIVLTTEGTVDTNGITFPNNVLTLTGDIGGMGDFIKTGLGTLILGGAPKTYPGMTNVSEGTLEAGAPNVLSPNSTHTIENGAILDLHGFDQKLFGLGGTGTVTTLTAPATLTLDTSVVGVDTFLGAMTDGASVLSFTKEGVGTQVFAGMQKAYSGPTLINAGILQAGDDDVLSPNSAHTIAAGATLDLAGHKQTFDGLLGLGTVASSTGFATLTINSAANDVFQGMLQDGGGVLAFTKTGAATLTFGGAQKSYSGPTLINAGTLQAGANDVFSPNSLHTVAGGAVLNLAGFNQTFGSIGGTGTITTTANPATLTLNPTAGTATFSGNLVDGSLGEILSFTKEGPGTQVFAGVQKAYSGPTLINAGILQAGGDDVLSPNSAHTIAAGATLDLAGHKQTFDGLLGSGTVTSSTGLATLTINSAANDVFQGMMKDGGGVLAFTKTGAATLAFGGAQKSYSGPTLVSQGALQAEADDVFSPNSAHTIAGGAVLDLNGHKQTFPQLGGTGSVLTTGAPAVLTLNTTVDQSFLGTLTDGSPTGALSLTKTGASTLSLPGVNTHSGPTTVQAGTLVVNGVLQNSQVTVGHGALLKGTGSVASAVVDGTIAPGNSIGTMTVLGNFAMGTGGTYQAEVDSTGTSDLINVLGSASLAGNLNVLMSGNPTDLVGKAYTILQAAGGVTGQFATNTTNLLNYTINYLGNAVQIVIASQLPTISNLLPAESNGNANAMANYLNSLNIAPGTDLAHVFDSLFSLRNDPKALEDALDQIQPSSLDVASVTGYWSMNNASNALQPQLSRLLQKAGDEVWAENDVCPCGVEERKPCGKNGFAAFKAPEPTRKETFDHLVHHGRMLAMNPQAAVQQSTMRQPKLMQNKFIETYDVQARTPPISQRIQIGKANVWFQNYGQLQDMKGSANSPGYRGRFGGLSTGADIEILPRTFVGTFAGVSSNPYDLKSNRGSGSSKSYYGGLYGATMTDYGLYTDGEIMAGGDNYHTTRKINFSDIHRRAHGKHNGYHIFVKNEVGQIVPLSKIIKSTSFDMMLQPFVNLAYGLNHEQGYQERGANSLNFRIRKRDSNFLRSEGGLKVYKTFMVCDTMMRPEFSLSYMNTSRVGGNRGRVRGGLVGEPQTLTVNGDKHTISQVAPELGLTTQFSNGAYILTNVRGELSGRLKTISGMVTLGYNF